MMTFAALVLILTPGVALGQQAARNVSIKEACPLDMAENSVDDRYDGCREEMTHLVQSKYLKRELSMSLNFSKAWHMGEKFCTEDKLNNLTRENCIALFAYTYDNSTIFKPFNNATRIGRGNYTNMTYGWYSLHFLLTDALRKKSEKSCKITYRGTDRTFEKEVTNTEIRFGSFTSSSKKVSVAQTFGKVSCFKIMTCHGVNIMNYSNYPEQEEVLIPPYEMFNVTDVWKRTAFPGLWCETVFELNSTGTRSNQQCELVKLEASGESQIYNRYQPLVVSSACVFTLIHTFLR
ncbi:erythroblast NAD(P)(+)--arginine ADP-ribosyltransferase-like [Sardina pilchardus]|uniref:erythroblast NAD(P)(+)--arginine ADP-ribosyltransferase-like n=1 Tax=Sardina pilchardus TaxID=27697 RepID=UPI002E1560D9